MKHSNECDCIGCAPGPFKFREDTYGLTTRTITVKQIYTHTEELPQIRNLDDLRRFVDDKVPNVKVVDKTTITHVTEFGF